MKLSTRWLGLTLAHPLVPSSSPLTRELDGIRRLEDAGAAAIVLPSLFEEELDMNEEAHEYYTRYGSEAFAEALDYFPRSGPYTHGAEHYLEHLKRAKAAVKVPVVASLNGMSPGGWLRYARMLQDAGADALELNVYFLAADPRRSAAEVEQDYLEIAGRVTSQVTIPVSLKISPFFTSLSHFAARAVEKGVKGLTLFNRFYQPDIDLEALDVVPQASLSTSADLRLPLRWIAILRSQLSVSLAATSGVHTALDALKLLMVGANVTMMCSALLQKGPTHLGQVLADLGRWGDEHGYESVEQLQGSMSLSSVPAPSLLERANYMKVLQSIP